jgi:hypothetical protein
MNLVAKMVLLGKYSVVPNNATDHHAPFDAASQLAFAGSSNRLRFGA